MERYSKILGRKKQYCENDYTTKCNLQIQYNPYQITNGIFHRTRAKTFTVHVETQRPRRAKAVLRKENGAGGSKLADFRLYHKATGIIGEGNGSPFPYSCLENPMDGGAWETTVHGVAESQT